MSSPIASNWALMIVRLTRSATLIPSRLMPVASAATTKIQKWNEVAGQSTSSALAVIRQITVGMKK